MPVVKTVKPGGGGDYTNLADWWAFARLQTDPEQWAECYTGNLGSLDITSPSAVSFTATASAYPKIYVAEGHQHDGIDPTSGAYATNILGKISIEGLAVNATTGSGIKGNETPVEGMAEATLILKDLLVHASADSCIEVTPRISSGGKFPALVQAINCVAIGHLTAVHATEAVNTVFQILNCTASWFYGNYGSNGTKTVEVKNCVCTHHGSASLDFQFINLADVTIDFANNISTDASADDYGGVNHLTNQIVSDLFEDTASGDYRLKSTSPARNAGVALLDVPDDILGLSRPQGDAYDIGAFEYEEETTTTTTTTPAPEDVDTFPIQMIGICGALHIGL